MTFRDSAGHVIAPDEADYEIAEDDSYYTTRPNTNTIRYNTAAPTHTQGNTRYTFHPDQVQTIPPRRSAPQTPRPQQATSAGVPTPQTHVKQKRHWHWLWYVGIGMIVMYFLWVGLTFAISWYNTWQDDLHYGRPRTFQFDAVVGHADSAEHPSHFIALNLNRHVVIIELPGGDTSKSRIYNITTLFGDGQDLTPVTLTFTNNKGDGKPDMIVHIQDQRILLHNDGTQFKP